MAKESDEEPLLFVEHPEGVEGAEACPCLQGAAAEPGEDC